MLILSGILGVGFFGNVCGNFCCSLLIVMMIGLIGVDGFVEVGFV